MSHPKKTVKTLLIVEDNKATCFMNKISINKTNLVENILTATNGADALNIINSGTIPEIILLDLNMPILNGWEFLNAYSKNRRFSETKIVMLLGEALSKDLINIAKVQYGITDFYSKVLNINEIQELVKNYYNRNINASA